MRYPWKADPGTGFEDVAVCNETCANAANVFIIDELTDGWIGATSEARCPGCGRLLVIEGQLTWAHYESDEEAASGGPRIPLASPLRLARERSALERYRSEHAAALPPRDDD